MANEWTRLTKKQRSGGVMAYREEFGDHAIAQGEFYEDKFDMYKYGQRVSLTSAELLALVTATRVWREVAEVQALVEAVREIVSELEAGAAPYKIGAALRLVKNQVSFDPVVLLPLVLAYKPFKETTDE